MILGPSFLNMLIQERGLITPNHSGTITKDSIDMRLESIMEHRGGAELTLDCRNVGEIVPLEPENGIWTLKPGKSYIGRTAEKIALPEDKAAIVIGRSTLFRSGCIVTVGFIDPGYHGQIHFEIYSPHGMPTKLGFGFPIIQLVFFNAEPTDPYNGVYQGGFLTPNDKGEN